MIALVFLGMAAAAAFDHPQMRESKKRDQTIYFIMFALVAVYSLLVVTGHTPTGPLEFVLVFFRDVLGIKLRAFG